jgi:hypothetical protein
MTGHIRRRGERSWELKFDIGADPVTDDEMVILTEDQINDLPIKLAGHSMLVRATTALFTGSDAASFWRSAGGESCSTPK